MPTQPGEVIRYTDNLTEDTVRRVATLAGQHSFSRRVDLASDLATVGVGDGDPAAEIAAIFKVVQQDIEWHRDPATGERIYTPDLLAKKLILYRWPEAVRIYKDLLDVDPGEGEEMGYKPKGDCDDKACLLMSMLLNRGHISRAVAAWQSLIPPYPGCPDPQNERWRRINHVYVEVKIPASRVASIGGTVDQGFKWLPLEPSSATLSAFSQHPAVKPVAYYYAKVDSKVIK